MSEQQPEPQPSQAAPATRPVVSADPQVDQALALLEELDGRPVDEHVAIFERVHGSLRETLNRPVDRPQPADGPAAPASPGSAPS